MVSLAISYRGEEGRKEKRRRVNTRKLKDELRGKKEKESKKSSTDKRHMPAESP